MPNDDEQKPPQPVILNTGNGITPKVKIIKKNFFLTFTILFLGWAAGLFLLVSLVFAIVQFTGVQGKITEKLASLQK